MQFTHINPVHRVGPYTFRSDADHETFSFYLDSAFCPDLRWTYADEITYLIRHRGWYCDDFQEDTMRGIVFRLPKSRGFLVGWTMGDGMISEIDRRWILDDEEQAAHAADECARVAAEYARDHQEPDDETETETE